MRWHSWRPFILYTGDEPWWAPADVFDLVDQVPESWKAHVPSMKCIVIDEKRCRPVAAGWSGPGPAWLNRPEDRELRRDFLAWFAKC